MCTPIRGEGLSHRGIRRLGDDSSSGEAPPRERLLSLEGRQEADPYRSPPQTAAGVSRWEEVCRSERSAPPERWARHRYSSHVLLAETLRARQSANVSLRACECSLR